MRCRCSRAENVNPQLLKSRGGVTVRESTIDQSEFTHQHAWLYIAILLTYFTCLKTSFARSTADIAVGHPE